MAAVTSARPNEAFNSIKKAYENSASKTLFYDRHITNSKRL